MDLKALTEGIHSKEALQLVKQHILGIMGPNAAGRFINRSFEDVKAANGTGEAVSHH